MTEELVFFPAILCDGRLTSQTIVLTLLMVLFWCVIQRSPFFPAPIVNHSVASFQHVRLEQS